MSECQYIGPEQTRAPFKYCGVRALEGKVYCADHYYVVYKKGTAVNGKKREKAVDQEIAELKRQQELEEIDNV